MTKVFHGSCHCGAVRFEVDIDNWMSPPAEMRHLRFSIAGALMLSAPSTSPIGVPHDL